MSAVAATSSGAHSACPSLSSSPVCVADASLSYRTSERVLVGLPPKDCFANAEARPGPLADVHTCIAECVATPVVMLRGPLGCGKRTLAATFAHASEDSHVLALSAHDVGRIAEAPLLHELIRACPPREAPSVRALRRGLVTCVRPHTDRGLVLVVRDVQSRVHVDAVFTFLRDAGLEMAKDRGVVVLMLTCDVAFSDERVHVVCVPELSEARICAPDANMLAAAWWPEPSARTFPVADDGVAGVKLCALVAVRVLLMLHNSDCPVGLLRALCDAALARVGSAAAVAHLEHALSELARAGWLVSGPAADGSWSTACLAAAVRRAHAGGSLVPDDALFQTIARAPLSLVVCETMLSLLNAEVVPSDAGATRVQVNSIAELAEVLRVREMRAMGQVAVCQSGAEYVPEVSKWLRHAVAAACCLQSAPGGAVASLKAELLSVTCKKAGSLGQTREKAMALEQIGYLCGSGSTAKAYLIMSCECFRESGRLADAKRVIHAAAAATPGQDEGPEMQLSRIAVASGDRSSHVDIDAVKKIAANPAHPYRVRCRALALFAQRAAKSTNVAVEVFRQAAELGNYGDGGEHDVQQDPLLARAPISCLLGECVLAACEHVASTLDSLPESGLDSKLDSCLQWATEGLNRVLSSIGHGSARAFRAIYRFITVAAQVLAHLPPRVRYASANPVREAMLLCGKAVLSDVSSSQSVVFDVSYGAVMVSCMCFEWVFRATCADGERKVAELKVFKDSFDRVCRAFDRQSPVRGPHAASVAKAKASVERRWYQASCPSGV